MAGVPGLPEELLAINLGGAGRGGGRGSRGVAGGAVGLHCGGHLGRCGATGGGGAAAVHGPRGVQTCSRVAQFGHVSDLCTNSHLGRWFQALGCVRRLQVAGHVEKPAAQRK